MTMCVNNTPVTYHEEYGLYVKHEELCCPGGPNFSKTRGVFAHISKRPEHLIGVLDTHHSQGGWAVARACSLLHKQCVVFYPVRKNERGAGLKLQQSAAHDLGAQLWPLSATASWHLYYQAKTWLRDKSDSYMMPNALKLPETVEETAREVERTPLPNDINAVLVSTSSGTIAAGVILGLKNISLPVIVHLGYSRSPGAVYGYLDKMTDGLGNRAVIVDEDYAYKDVARPGIMPPFLCNQWYDLKAFRWWLVQGRDQYGKTLFWNIG